MKKNFKIILIFFISISSFAQEKNQSVGRRSVVKLNLSGAALGTATFQYEKALGKRVSFAIGAGFRPEKLIPFAKDIEKYINFADNKIDYISFDNVKKAESKIGMFHVTPELRFYFGKKEAPIGLYLAVFGKYNDFHGKVPVFIDIDYKNLPIRLELPVDTKLQTYSGGLMLGKQFQLGNRFTFDWYIAGGHVGRANVHGESIQNLESFDDDFRTRLRNRILTSFNIKEDYLSVIVNTKGVTIDNVRPLNYYNLRGFGFNLGYRF